MKNNNNNCDNENVNNNYINMALDELINTKHIIYKNNTKGYIKYINSYYVFQPDFNMNEYNKQVHSEELFNYTKKFKQRTNFY